jgi:hypothetical protein
MFRVLKDLIRDEAAQDLAEYGIALGVIVGFAGLIAVAIAGQVNVLWSNGQTVIDAAAS